MSDSTRRSYLSPPRSFLVRGKWPGGKLYEMSLRALLEATQPFKSDDRARGLCAHLLGATLVPLPAAEDWPSTPRKAPIAS